MGWELRQACAHPEWPARLVALGPAAAGSAVAAVIPAGTARTIRVAQAITRQTVQPQSSPIKTPIAPVQPLLVRAGDRVRLWMQDATVHIEMSGVAEQSARGGERVVVRIVQQTEDAGLAVQRIAGVVRGAGDVEMER
jgi:flagella basal body P-ring formation protein FlgA